VRGSVTLYSGWPHICPTRLNRNSPTTTHFTLRRYSRRRIECR
jgi:hypothetical protein